MICNNCGKEFECEKCIRCIYKEDNDCECDACFFAYLDRNVANDEANENKELDNERKMFCGKELLTREKVLFT